VSIGVRCWQWLFPNGAGKPRVNGSLHDANRRVLAHAKIAKRVTIHGLRRTATDLLRRAAVDPVAAKAIIGHTTDRMREHYSTVGADEAAASGSASSRSCRRCTAPEVVDQVADRPSRVRARQRFDFAKRWRSLKKS
jgi:integrase